MFADRYAVSAGGAPRSSALDLHAEHLSRRAATVTDLDVAVLAEVVTSVDRLEDPLVTGTPGRECFDGSTALDPRIWNYDVTRSLWGLRAHRERRPSSKTRWCPPPPAEITAVPWFILDL
jgi:hypothetical protein